MSRAGRAQARPFSGDRVDRRGPRSYLPGKVAQRLISQIRDKSAPGTTGRLKRISYVTVLSLTVVQSALRRYMAKRRVGFSAYDRSRSSSLIRKLYRNAKGLARITLKASLPLRG